MITRFKAAAVFVVATLVLAMPLVAQANSPTLPTLPTAPAGLQSNQSRATAGVFGSYVDDSMDVHWHSANGEAEDKAFDKWMGFIGYGGRAANPIQLGYARRFGGIYLGTWYTGNIAAGTDTTTEAVTQTFDLDNQLQSNKITTTTYAQHITSSNNQIAALIGVGGMGIKVGFWEAMYQSKNPNVSTTVTDDLRGVVTHTQYEIDQYVNYGGHLMPSLEWGMKIGVGDGGLQIRPKVGMSFDIYQNKQIIDTKAAYSTQNGAVIGADPTITSAGRSNGYVKPAFNVGAAIGLPAPEKTSKSIDFSYGIGFGVYSNDYDVFGFSDKVKGTVNWNGATSSASKTLVGSQSAKSVTLNITEVNSDLDHDISVGFYYDKEILENFTLGLYTALPFAINVDSTNVYTKTFGTTRNEYDDANWGVNTTTTVEGTGRNTVTDTTSLEIAPYFNLGAKYALFPGRFQINAGIALRPFVFTSTTTKTAIDSNKNIVKTKTVDDNGTVLVDTVMTSDAGAPTGGINSSTTTDVTFDSERVANEWTQFSASLSGGFVFLFNDRAALDMAVNSGNSNAGFTLNTTTVNVLVTLKF